MYPRTCTQLRTVTTLDDGCTGWMNSLYIYMHQQVDKKRTLPARRPMARDKCSPRSVCSKYHAKRNRDSNSHRRSSGHVRACSHQTWVLATYTYPLLPSPPGRSNPSHVCSCVWPKTVHPTLPPTSGKEGVKEEEGTDALCEWRTLTSFTSKHSTYRSSSRSSAMASRTSNPERHKQHSKTRME
jgi:hypothetical protein